MAPSFLRKRYSAVCWPCSNSLASSAATAARSSGWTRERQKSAFFEIFVGAVAEHALDVRRPGGASGGPWLSNVNSGWMGTVTTVNSYKPNAATLFAPYFGSAEQAVFQNVRAR